MKKIYRNSLILLAIFAACTLSSGCGCGKKKKADDASTKVMEITITPEATPTQAPEQVDPKAVVKNGNLTMVNLYLAEKKEEKAVQPKEQEDTEGEENGSEE